MLEEVALGNPANELGVGQKPVFAAVLLAAAAQARRCGNGDLELGDAVEQSVNQSAFPGARRAGHDEDGLTG